MYVTYGSQVANPDPQLQPPHRRYFSDRVWYVRQLAKQAGERFGIITAQYGLVFEENAIPLHDHIIEFKEIESLGKETAKVLKQQGVSSVVFFIVPEEYSEGGAAYRYNLVMQLACRLAGALYTMKPIQEPLGERTHGEPTPVKPEYIEIGGPYSMNKNAEPSMYELRAQNDQGIWKPVRKSSFLPDLQIKARSLAEKFPGRKVEIVVAENTEKFSF